MVSGCLVGGREPSVISGFELGWPTLAKAPDMLGVVPLEWTADEEFMVDGITYTCTGARGVTRSSANRFRIVKPRRHIERYQELVCNAKPNTIVELGIFDGGSTALLAQVACPNKLIAIDLMPDPCAALEDFLDQRHYRGRVATFYGVDQSDTGHLSEILDKECPGMALDLVIDDASHLLDPTRASFNFLFPRLAPGGASVWVLLPSDSPPTPPGYRECARSVPPGSAVLGPR